MLTQEAVQAGNRTGITAKPEFYPKDDKTGIRVTPAQIRDKSNFLRILFSDLNITQRANPVLNFLFVTYVL